jgi:hypothetical protein
MEYRDKRSFEALFAEPHFISKFYSWLQNLLLRLFACIVAKRSDFTEAGAGIGPPPVGRISYEYKDNPSESSQQASKRRRSREGGRRKIEGGGGE